MEGGREEGREEGRERERGREGGREGGREEGKRRKREEKITTEVFETYTYVHSLSSPSLPFPVIAPSCLPHSFITY